MSGSHQLEHHLLEGTVILLFTHLKLRLYHIVGQLSISHNSSTKKKYETNGMKIRSHPSSPKVQAVLKLNLIQIVLQIVGLME